MIFGGTTSELAPASSPTRARYRKVRASGADQKAARPQGLLPVFRQPVVQARSPARTCGQPRRALRDTAPGRSPRADRHRVPPPVPVPGALSPDQAGRAGRSPAGAADRAYPRSWPRQRRPGPPPEPGAAPVRSQGALRAGAAPGSPAPAWGRSGRRPDRTRRRWPDPARVPGAERLRPGEVLHPAPGGRSVHGLVDLEVVRIAVHQHHRAPESEGLLLQGAQEVVKAGAVRGGGGAETGGGGGEGGCGSEES